MRNVAKGEHKMFARKLSKLQLTLSEGSGDADGLKNR